MSRGMYVGQLKSIISSESESQDLIQFIKKHKINELTFYTGGPAEKRVLPEMKKEFSVLLTKIWKCGTIKNVNLAIGDSIEIDRSIDFILSTNSKITGFTLEYEWWNHRPRDFSNALALLKEIRQVSKLQLRKPVSIGAYIGWTSQEEMNDLVLYVDRLLIHSYVQDGKQTFNLFKDRLTQVATTGWKKKIGVFALFSAEWEPEEVCDSGSSHPEFFNQMCFMGKWLKENGIKNAEKAFKDSEKESRESMINWRKTVSFKGFYYFEYNHLKKVIK